MLNMLKTTIQGQQSIVYVCKLTYNKKPEIDIAVKWSNIHGKE